jgi:hypothetical protein
MRLFGEPALFSRLGISLAFLLIDDASRTVEPQLSDGSPELPSFCGLGFPQLAGIGRLKIGDWHYPSAIHFYPARQEDIINIRIHESFRSAISSQGLRPSTWQDS